MVKKKCLVDRIIDLINEKFDQDHMPEFNVPYDFEGCKVFFWPCGAIILNGSQMRTISEDDGHWSVSSVKGISMSSSWIPKFVECLNAVNKYLKENGKPYYYSGTDIICGYEI